MKQSLKISDILALGFMTFAFFLGAGNIMLPPELGQQAGENLVPAMFGFLFTGVGLPLLGIIAVAISGGGWSGLTRDLPAKIAMLIAIAIFIVIGPAYAAPRAGLVAFDMGVKPYLSAGLQASSWSIILFSLIFFGLAMLFAWSRGSMIDMIGKFLTPALFIALAALAIAVIVNPQGEILAAKGTYVDQAFTNGFVNGYQTMDAFASLMFGMLIVDVLRKKGITDSTKTCHYLIAAGLIAAAGLAFVYLSLVYLGATSGNVAQGLTKGTDILTAYVPALFGSYGLMILSVIVILACFTTVVGLVSAVSDYFSTISPLSYKQWVVINAVACGIVANVGLTQLMTLSLPVLFAMYPVAIALIALTFVRRWLPNPRLAYALVIGVAFAFALFDALSFFCSTFMAKDAAINLTLAPIFSAATAYMPLYSYYMAWVLPTAVALLLSFALKRSAGEPLTPASA
ncbi:Branched-chain amino acid transport system 2 carrier protein [Vibrio stylophorae]|uniref:Branched-chain amino acid transport system carrier protein n=1 Tax=Vibrio stylophorae TaxID=659351 RepID=A0ABM8ZQU1_9VIBR|nr:branched-chain amino acid transport system II carrier protein [Vibrio stylophorae]CAH0532672.1 Branched-chain amino acid transport system 2 carrier protein [Vibrio stylophorae]